MRRRYILFLETALVFISSILMTHSSCFGQFLQGPQNVPQDQEFALKNELIRTKANSVRIILLLKLGGLYCNKPFPHKANLDAAFHFSRQAMALSSTLGYAKGYNDAQFLIALTFLRNEQIDSAVRILNFVNDTTRFNLLLAICDVYRIRVNSEKESDRAKAMQFAEMAKRLSDSINIPEKKILAIKAISSIHADTNKPNAEEELLDVLRMFQKINYPYLHYTYFELVSLSGLKGNYDKALYYSQLELNSMTKTRDSAQAGDYLLNHAIILRLIGQHENSIKTAKLAIEQYKHQYGDGNIPMAIQPLLSEMIKLKRIREANDYLADLTKNYPPENIKDSIEWMNALGQFYRETKQFDIAEKYLLKELSLLNRSGKTNFFTFHSLGQFYVESGQYARAKFYLEKALKLADSSVSMRTLGHLHYCLFVSDSALGNYVSAIKHLSKNKRYDDSVLKETKESAIQKYLVQFETAKKESSIKLKDQEIKVKEANLIQTRLIKNITLIASIVLLAVGLIFYIQFRQKQKSNRIISQKNEELQNLVKEKEWLLKEVHHRVKNNLHTIICLLESQAMYLDSDALQAIEKSQHRVYAMSLVHQKLYQNDDIRSIDMAVYLLEFIEYLKGSFETGRIKFFVDVEPIMLSLSQAIPVALIINETVTNSIKYAFDDNSEAEITISIKEISGLNHLTITDNGKGFDIVNENDSLGIQLIKGLSKEIKGTVLFEKLGGTKVTVIFRNESVIDPASKTSPKTRSQTSI